MGIQYQKNQSVSSGSWVAWAFRWKNVRLEPWNPWPRPGESWCMPWIILHRINWITGPNSV